MSWKWIICSVGLEYPLLLIWLKNRAHICQKYSDRIFLDFSKIVENFWTNQNRLVVSIISSSWSDRWAEPGIAAGTRWWIRFGSNNEISQCGGTLVAKLDPNALCQPPNTNNQRASKDSLHSPRPNGFWWNFIKRNCEIATGLFRLMTLSSHGSK